MRELGVEPRDAALVSSSPWDVAGAGLDAAWIYGLPLEELDAAPDAVVKIGSS